MSDRQIISLVMEWWRAAGPKSEERLADLVAHFAAQYQRDPATLLPAALEARYVWER